MAISFDNALGLQQANLNARAHRAGVLANNLANVNTPGFKARDINFQNALNSYMQKGGASMKGSHGAHFSSARMGGAVDKLYRMSNQPTIDGNTVDEQIEHAEFMKNSMEFQAAFTFLNSRFKGLTKAIKGE